MTEMVAGSGSNFGVDGPAIPTVFDAASGTEVKVSALLTAEEATVMQLRFDVKRQIQLDRARYLCPECFVPVSLVSIKEGRRFYFRHLVEDGRCSAVTRGELSQPEINARKYNGAKESYLHREMKQWLADSLHASGQFADIVQEARWTGRITGAWRKPDVSARYGTLKVAFEVQLSTTFLDVIAERWNFYQQEGGLVVWVFARFDGARLRLTQDDLFFLNNQNAFVVSQETRDASVTARDFLLDCAWSEPAPAHASPSLGRARVSFSQLTLDTVRQQAYYFDHRGHKAALQAARDAQRRNWPATFEAWWLDVAGKQRSQEDQEDSVWDFPARAPLHWTEGACWTRPALRPTAARRAVTCRWQCSMCSFRPSTAGPLAFADGASSRSPTTWSSRTRSTCAGSAVRWRCSPEAHSSRNKTTAESGR